MRNQWDDKMPQLGGWPRLRVVAAVTVLAASVSACAVKGNDTGGIISWRAESNEAYMAYADNHCAMHGKYAVITSVHPWEGGYVGFKCNREGRTVPYRN